MVYRITLNFSDVAKICRGMKKGQRNVGTLVVTGSRPPYEQPVTEAVQVIGWQVCTANQGLCRFSPPAPLDFPLTPACCACLPYMEPQAVSATSTCTADVPLGSTVAASSFQILLQNQLSSHVKVEHKFSVVSRGWGSARHAMLSRQETVPTGSADITTPPPPSVPLPPSDSSPSTPPPHSHSFRQLLCKRGQSKCNSYRLGSPCLYGRCRVKPDLYLVNRLPAPSSGLHLLTPR